MNINKKLLAVTGLTFATVASIKDSFKLIARLATLIQFVMYQLWYFN